MDNSQIPEPVYTAQQVPQAAPPVTSFPAAQGMPAQSPQTGQSQQMPYQQMPPHYGSGVPQPSAIADGISNIPPEANDVDVIEKEWVNHLKDIAGRTGSNPYLQQQEISRAKADYMKKRYNKDIKMTEA